MPVQADDRMGSYLEHCADGIERCVIPTLVDYDSSDRVFALFGRRCAACPMPRIALHNAPRRQVDMDHQMGHSQRGLVLLIGIQSEFFNHIIAHYEFLWLARDGYRQFILDADTARDFVVGDLAVAECPNFLLGCHLAIMQDDPGSQFLAEFLVRNAEYLNLGNLGIAVKIFLFFRADRYFHRRGSPCP